jgi:serine/threonine-protein kinase HipA
VTDEVDVLAVWLNDTVVGTLRRDRRGISLSAGADARRLTASSEGSKTPWSPAFTRSWFDNLLPDTALRQSVADAHAISPTDLFGLLAVIGWECAGAVSVLPEGRRPATGSYRALSPDELWKRLDALPFVAPEGEDAVHMSLGGAQAKTLLRRGDDGWQLPVDGAISTHILKPEPVHFEGLALAEAFCLEAASAATPSARAEVMTVPGHRPTLVVERFDRVVASGGLERVHQEDGCQILGLPASARFAVAQPSPARASYAAIARVLVRRAEDPAAELGRLLEQTTVNIALGNRDAHGKNHSVQHVDGSIRLSPMYDVSPSRPFIRAAYQRDSRYSAMLVDGRRVFDSITRGSLVREARSWGVPADIGRGTVASTLERLAIGIAEAKQRYPGTSPAAVAEIDESYSRLRSSDW